jgi:hypothetical protein
LRLFFNLNAHLSLWISIKKKNVSKNDKKLIFKKIFFKNFKLFFLFNHTSFSRFHIHHNYYYFFQCDNKILNYSKFIYKWNNFNELIYNMYYYSYNSLIFSSFLFKKEISSINWYFTNLKNINWKYSSLFFFLKTNKFHKKIDFFYYNLKKFYELFLVISDTNYHFKNLYYYNKYNFFSIGLVPFNLNPWNVSFALPVMINNFFIQLFFIKILIYIYKNCYLLKYKRTILCWKNIKNLTS